MTRRFIVRPLAEVDLEDAARWYEDERAGLSVRFLSDVRRALRQTFPYAVYFRTSDEAVVVLAVLHLRRNPKVWRWRVR